MLLLWRHCRRVMSISYINGNVSKLWYLLPRHVSQNAVCLSCIGGGVGEGWGFSWVSLCSSLFHTNRGFCSPRWETCSRTWFPRSRRWAAWSKWRSSSGTRWWWPSRSSSAAKKKKNSQQLKKVSKQLYTRFYRLISDHLALTLLF